MGTKAVRWVTAEGLGHVYLKKSLGVAGVGVAVGAAVAIPASAASAGTTYNSTATATAGFVSIAGNPVPIPNSTVTATDTSGPQSQSVGMSSLTSALPNSPLGSSAKATFPTGANLMTETATASSNGMSTACAGFLSGDCSHGKPQPITLSLSLADLPGLPPLPGVPGTGGSSSSSRSSGSSGSSGNSPLGLPTKLPVSLPTSLPGLGGSSSSGTSGSGSSASSSSSKSSSSSSSNPLAGYQLVLTLSGPQAACTAGPPGSSGSNFTATQSLGSGSVDILDNGKSVLPNGPLSLSAGNVLSQLNNSLPSSLLNVLPKGGLSGATPIDLTVNPGSTSGAGSGPVTSATAGELALSLSGNPVLDIIGAKATCGPNTKAALTKPKTTSAEKPLGGGIQTDEGRSGPGSGALWPGVAGGASFGALAGGLTLWRRRRGLSAS